MWPTPYLSSGPSAVYRPYPVAQYYQLPRRAAIGNDPLPSFTPTDRWWPSRPDLLWPAVQMQFGRRQTIPLAPIGDPPLPVNQPEESDTVQLPAFWPRPWPQVQLEQRLPITPQVVVVAADTFPLTPWEWENKLQPAYYRDWSIPLLTQRLRLMPLGGDPAAFPFLGAWTPGIMDPPSMRTHMIPLAPKVSIGDAPLPVRQPLALAQVLRYPIPELYQRLPVTPQVVVVAQDTFPLTPWQIEQLQWPAYLRDWPIPLLTQTLRLLPIGGDPIAFPPLGEWLPGTMDPPKMGVQVTPLAPKVAVGDGPVTFPALGRWQPGIMDGPGPWVQLRQNHAPLVAIGGQALGPQNPTALPSIYYRLRYPIPELFQRLPFLSNAPTIALLGVSLINVVGIDLSVLGAAVGGRPWSFKQRTIVPAWRPM